MALATKNKLKLVFATATGNHTWNFSNIDGSINSTRVNALMDTMIANGSVYKYIPLTKVSATFERVTETEIEITTD